MLIVNCVQFELSLKSFFDVIVMVKYVMLLHLVSAKARELRGEE